MKIHFIGIGGIGVSALAQYYLAKGHRVSGSDLVSSETTALLKKKGAKITIVESEIRNPKSEIRKSIEKSELVIYSPAVPKNHPELKFAKKLGIDCKSYPEALGELTKKYFTIAVCGTHGKSTTTAMISLILVNAGLDPTVIIGTKLKEFGNSNCRVGKSKYLVIEADEWNASFLNYWPKIIVSTNIEKEHLDYYKNLKHILRTYQEFFSHLPKNGVLVLNGEDRNIKKIISNFFTPLDMKLSNGASFSIFNFQTGKSKDIPRLKKILKVPGEHNVLNALAALKVARVLKIPDRISFKALSEYKGAWRRFEQKELKIEKEGARRRREGGEYDTSRGVVKLKIISDYAHHPTEIKATLKAAREKFPNKKIWCIFQPHQYQRTFYLFKDFVKVFQQAENKSELNKLIITDIYSVAGREKGDIKNKINSKKIVKAINRPWAIYLPKEKIINHLKKNLKGGEVVIIMGAGDIYRIIDN